MHIGKNIKLIRINLGLKQKELAKELGVKVQHLCAIENEKKEPSLRLLKRTAKALDVPIGVFFWEDEGPIAEKFKKMLFDVLSMRDKNEE
jgi:transcriptional regulator with XRE-family HTH domain